MGWFEIQALHARLGERRADARSKAAWNQHRAEAHQARSRGARH